MIPHTLILLRRDGRRVENFASNIKPNVPEIQIFEAVDCETEELENFLNENKNIKIGETYIKNKAKRGGIANVFSHMKIWKKIVDEKIPEMVILEDDANVPSGYLEHLSAVRKELPSDYDFCHLFVQPFKLKRAHDTRQYNLSNKFFINNGYQTLGMIAYLISFSCAKKLLKEFEVVKQLVDMQINKLIKKQETNGYRFFTVKNNAVNKIGRRDVGFLPTNVLKTSQYTPEGGVAHLNLMKFYLFDIDGTLTEPRCVMSSDFTSRFLAWMTNKKVFLVTGSDYPKVLEQIPNSVLSRCAGVFSSMANELRQNEKIVYQKRWKPPSKLISDLTKAYLKCDYPKNLRSKNYIEERCGMLNFSIVGREASIEQRAMFSRWDKQNKERKKITEWLSLKHPDLDFKIGGQVSIDVQPKGKNKSQACQWLLRKSRAELYFFGDKCDKDGNDYDIYKYILDNKCGEAFSVSGPKETLDIIDKINV